MNHYGKYQNQTVTTAWTRIDLLLALYDGALERLDRAESALQSGDQFGAVSQISRVQLIICELAIGVRLDIEPELGENMLRLYEYCTNELRQPELSNIGNARHILSTLREGFEAIREEAVHLETTGQLTSVDDMKMVHTMA